MIQEDLINTSIGARCLVLSAQNQFLFLGKLAYYDNVNQKLRIEEYNNRPFLKQFEPGVRIKLHIKQKSDAKQFVLIEGITEEFLDNYLFLTPVSVTQKQEERQYFRQNVMAESIIAFVNRKATGHSCMIIDISATGIALQSKIKYEIGDRLWIYNQQFRKNGPAHTVESIIVRKKNLENNQFFYGCQFVDLSPDEEDKLFCDIFALQSTDLNAKRDR